MSVKSLFLLNPEITYLNFGSFGACPEPVFNEYLNFEKELETEPVQFITKNGPAYLKKSAEALAGYIHCAAEDLVFTPNPTFAINIIARNLDLKPGDEILTTNLEYGAMDRTWNFICKKTGAKYIRQEINLPITGKEKFLEEFFKGLSAKTRVVFISQITSATALVLPVQELCDYAKSKGLITIVDGAHVPGHIPLNISKLHADVYTGACHKWMMTPKGCSFLYVTKSLQDTLEPLIVSWGYESEHSSGSKFFDYHQYNGTRDFSAFLTIPASLKFMREHSWEKVSAECKALVRTNVQRFSKLLNAEPLCPVNEEWLGQMCSFPLRNRQPESLYKQLFENYKIEVPVMWHEKNVYLRYSINGFNSQEDLDKLFLALEDIGGW